MEYRYGAFQPNGRTVLAAASICTTTCNVSYCFARAANKGVSNRVVTGEGLCMQGQQAPFSGTGPPQPQWQAPGQVCSWLVCSLKGLLLIHT